MFLGYENTHSLLLLLLWDSLEMATFFSRGYDYRMRRNCAEAPSYWEFSRVFSSSLTYSEVLNAIEEIGVGLHDCRKGR